MAFIPHTAQDIKEMLEVIGIDSIPQLFNEIPSDLRQVDLTQLPAGLSEMELTQFINQRARQDEHTLCFIGAGAYEHYIPAAVWQIASRGEWMTAYTPYQAEASQGSLQLIYEYQTMMANLMQLEVSNASLYDGASALAEAILMAVRLNKKNKTTVLLPTTIHPRYRQVAQTIVSQQNIQLIPVPYDPHTGQIDMAALLKLDVSNVAALVIPQPNFFGVLEEVDQLTEWTQTQNILSIAVVNPLTMALLKPPGAWGKNGADIACGEGQPLGIPLAGGGPYYGFLCSKKNYVRQMPGRIVGRTIDTDGKTGYTLTLQAREQHIRRAKATSNICTNQGLMVTASTIYMSLLGPRGLRHIALLSHKRTRQLRDALTQIADIQFPLIGPFFHEFIIRFKQPAEKIQQQLAEQGIQFGYALANDYPELSDCILLCATETKSDTDIEFLLHHLIKVKENIA